MLRFLRKYSSSTGIKILYGVLAGLFIIWGVGAVGGERVDVVARVHGETITRRELDRETALLQRRYEELFRRFGTDLARSLDLRSQALDELIDNALLHDEAERLGIRVSDADLIESITKMPELQDAGRFNRERLEAFLRERRDRGEFEGEIRRSLLFDRLRSLVTDGVQVSDAEVEQRYHLDRDQLNLDFVRIPAADFTASATPSEEDLAAYLGEHADRYRVPARVRARYVAFRPAELRTQVEVKDGEVAEYYELNKDERFTEPEQVRARHILVKVAAGADDAAKAAARKKAEDLLTKVKAGADFAELARKNSDDPGSAAKGGDLDLFPRGRMAPEFERAAFALEAGQVSDVVETPFGFHIIKVEEHPAGGPKPLEAVREEIVKTIRDERALELAHRQAEDARRSVARGKSFADAVAPRPLGETPPFAAGDEIPGIGRLKAFTDAAFALGDGEVSDLVETDDAIYLLAPFARVEAHTPPLEEVRKQLTADARRERAEAAANEKAERLLTRAREVGLAKAAAEAGAALEQTGRFDRRAGAIPKIDALPALVSDALALTPDAPLAPKAYVAAGDAVVAALRERVPADMAGYAAAKDAIHESLLQQRRSAILREYLDFLKQRAQHEGALEVRADALGRG